MLTEQKHSQTAGGASGFFETWQLWQNFKCLLYFDGEKWQHEFKCMLSFFTIKNTSENLISHSFNTIKHHGVSEQNFLDKYLLLYFFILQLTAIIKDLNLSTKKENVTKPRKNFLHWCWWKPGSSQGWWLEDDMKEIVRRMSKIVDTLNFFV